MNMLSALARVHSGAKSPTDKVIFRETLLVLLLLSSVPALSSCGKRAVECSSADATSATTDLVKTSLEKAIYDKGKAAGGDFNISRSNIRAAIAQLGLVIQDIRTSREDPNSTKHFCEGTLKVTFPADTIQKAEQARSAVGLGTITQLADASDIDREADSFEDKIEYDVQPTDNGDKVFSETNSGAPIINLVSEIVSASLIEPTVQQAAVAEQEAKQAQQAQQDAALAQQKAANLNSARTDDQLASQQILAVWRALPAEVRSKLLPLQRAWAQKKDADCKVEAANASTDPEEMETARLNCDVRETRERTDALEQVRNEVPEEQTPEQADGT